MKRLFISLVCGISMLALGLVAQPASAGTYDPEAPCVTRAMQVAHAGQQWTCFGRELDYNSGTKTKPVWKALRVSAVPVAKPGKVLAAASGEWCTTQGACSKLISPYIGYTKGNAVYGVGKTEYGRMAIDWRQAFDGKWSRWRLYLHWKSGWAVDPHVFVAKQIQENFGPDSMYCTTDFYPAAVSKIKTQAWSPGKKTYKYCAKATTKKEDWHDDLYGWFYCNGTQFKTGTLHTGRWKSWRSKHGWRQIYKSKWVY